MSETLEKYQDFFDSVFEAGSIDVKTKFIIPLRFV